MPVSVPTPVLQFGTSRFLQAHADLFISEAMQRGEAIGGITVVQTTASAESATRIHAFNDGTGYPVLIRGLEHGVPVDETKRGWAVQRALQADHDWSEVRGIAVMQAEIILSNTGEQGFVLDPRDGEHLAGDFGQVPRAFPAKLLTLLYERWLLRPEAPLSLFPCELMSRNGDRLRDIVCALAARWKLPDGFISYMRDHCRWANSLVDRIVSEPIHPVGAVAEPYALWAIERQDGLLLPCRHDALVVTDDLDTFERLKLHLLNLGHTCLAELWLVEKGPAGMTVLDALGDPAMRQTLEAVWHEEVLPVFHARGMGDLAEDYVRQVRERFLNPYLVHRLADIAQNHDEKKRRRLIPVIENARELGLQIPQSRLRKAVARLPHMEAPAC